MAERASGEKGGISGLSRILSAAVLPVALTAGETSWHCRPESAPDFFPACSSAIAASLSDIIPVLRFLKLLLFCRVYCGSGPTSFMTHLPQSVCTLNFRPLITRTRSSWFPVSGKYFGQSLKQYLAGAVLSAPCSS